MVFVFVFILQKSLLPNNNYKYLTRKDMSTYDAKTPSMYNDDDDSEYLFTLELAIYAALPSNNSDNKDNKDNRAVCLTIDFFKDERYFVVKPARDLQHRSSRLHFLRLSEYAKAPVTWAHTEVVIEEFVKRARRRRGIVDVFELKAEVTRRSSSSEGLDDLVCFFYSPPLSKRACAPETCRLAAGWIDRTKEVVTSQLRLARSYIK
jgi:hypothetical protein